MFPASRLPISIQIPLDRLRPYVQEAITDYLLAARPELHAREVRKTEVRLSDEIRLWEDGERLITEVPLEIETRVLPSLFGGLAVLNLLDRISVIRFGIRLRLHTRLRIRPEGNLHAATEARFYWEQKPMAGLVSLATVLGPMIENQMPEITEAVDMAIPEAVPLREYEAEIWQKLCTWEAIESEPPLWFRLAPEQRETDRNLQLSQGGISWLLTLRGHPEIRLQQAAPSAPAIPPLPEEYAAALSTEAEGTQYLQIISTPGYLNAYLKEQTFNEGDASIAVRAPQLMAREDHWELRLQLSGKVYRAAVEGELSLFLKLSLETDQPVIELLDYELHTASLALRMTLWVWSKARLQKLIQTELDALLGEIERAIRESWATFSLPEPFFWQVAEIAPHLLRWDLRPEQLQLTYRLQGKANVILG